MGATLALVTFGCSAPKTKFPHNVVAIHPDGTLYRLSGQTDRKGRSKLVKRSSPTSQAERESYRETTRKHLSYIFENNPELDKQQTVLLFIQGGLNDVKDGTARADRLTEAILKDTNSPAYPIFIAWDANLISAWGEQYTTHRGLDDKAFGIVLAPLTFTANLGRLLSRLPFSTFEQGYAGMRTLRAPCYGGGTNEPHWIPRPEQANQQYDILLSTNYSVQFEPGQKSWTLPARGVLMLFEAIPKVLCGAIVDTGGKAGWDFMLRRTKTMFTLSRSLDRGGMDFFGEELVKYMRAHPNKRLVIVGHSMGSIVANELIRRFGDQLTNLDIVYMAAACGVDDFDHVVIPHLLKHPETTFYNLSLHPGNDISELPCPWWAELLTPRGSLLDWIDFYYSSTDTEYGWTLGKWDNAIIGSKRFLSQQLPENQEKLKKQVHFKNFGYGPELEYGPQHHGGFDQWKFWEPAFWKLGTYDTNWYYGPP